MLNARGHATKAKDLERSTLRFRHIGLVEERFFSSHVQMNAVNENPDLETSVLRF